MKAVIRGKLIAESAYIKTAKQEGYRIHTEKLRELEKKYQNTYDPKICQQIKEIRENKWCIIRGN